MSRQENDAPAKTAGDWELPLFTCTLSGALRMTVRCRLINTEWLS